MNVLTRWFSGMSIRWKFAAIATAASLTAMTAGFALFVALDLAYFRAAFERELSVDALVAAEQSEAAVIFDDTRSAESILRIFGAKPHFTRIIIFDRNGQPFASHVSAGAEGRPPPDPLRERAGALELPDGMRYLQPMDVEGDRVGWVYIESNFQEMRNRINWYLSAAVIIGLLWGAVTVMAALMLQGAVSRPILRLAQMARRISTEQDYTARAEGTHAQEIGDLYQAFNQMLTQIQSRDKRLAEHAVHLEEEVARRTIELRRTNELLEKELEERRVAEARLRESERKLNLALEEAINATQLKDKFVSLVSHDLRSPLSGVKGMVDLLRQPERYEFSRERIQETLERIYHTVDSMITMTSKLLDTSRFRTGKMVIHPRLLDPRALADKHIAQVKPLAERKGITVINETPPGAALFADLALFGEVVHNLLTNAVKFARRGDTVTVFMPEGRPTTIAVRDTGPGVKKEFLPNLFRHDVKTTELGSGGEVGTGLGLPCCHDIITLHGGALEVESEEGRGAVFYATAPPVEKVALVIDADGRRRAEVVAALREAWPKAGFVEAADAVEALGALQGPPPALVVVSLATPGLSGTELLEAIRANEPYRATPLVVIGPPAGDGHFAELRGKALDLGATEVVDGANAAAAVEALARSIAP